MKRVIKGVYIVPMGFANAFLIEGDDELALIDDGFPGKESAVLTAIRGLGRSPDQLKHLVFTHAHPIISAAPPLSCAKPVCGPNDSRISDS